MGSNKIRGNVHIGEALEYLPDELRVLEWRKSPLSLSSKCCLPRQLVVLEMSKSNIILENAFKQGFQELPSSLLYLTGLVELHPESCSKLANFPDIPSAKLRLACNSFHNFSEPTGFPCVTRLSLCECPGIKDGLDSWMQPDYFPVLTSLDLFGTGIVTIPESISRFTTLLDLRINNCKKLREIPRLPQSLRCVDAGHCDRLDTESSSRLLNQIPNGLGPGVIVYYQDGLGVIF
nr:hypothetical protein CFP56_43399 [Quercus suber]